MDFGMKVLLWTIGSYLGLIIFFALITWAKDKIQDLKAIENEEPPRFYPD